jgi:hypothetical protein
MHYMRQLRHNDPLGYKPRMPLKGGIRKHPMYSAYAGMLNRCFNPNNTSYGRYGAVEITVCDRWRADFRNFFADMGERPEGMTLDRKDPRGPYDPDNCRWATAKEQRANLLAANDQRSRLVASQKKREFWTRKRSANLTPIGERIKRVAASRGETIMQMAARYGYSSSGYITDVSFGHKPAGTRLQAALDVDEARLASGA